MQGIEVFHNVQLGSKVPIAVPPFATEADGPECEGPLLTLAGPISGSHALVLTGRGSDLICSLIRRGSLAAMSLRSTEKPEVGLYDLVLMPQVTSDACLDHLVHQARRALVPTGRVVARVTQDPSGRAALALVRALRLNGFVAVRAKALAGETLLRADLPAFGMAANA
jgi:hypothetical protein